MISTPQKIRMIKTSDIGPNPYQTRKKFDRKELKLLCESIKEVGMLSPVIVRGGITGYELICGQRRLRAAIMAGMNEVPAIVIRAGDFQCAQLSMIENIQRVNLGLSEEAEGYFNLMTYHRIKKDKLLRSLSADNTRVNEKVRLLSLSENLRYKIEENNIPEKTARELLKLHNEEIQYDIIERIAADELNHREVCVLIKQILREMTRSEQERKRDKRKKYKTENMPLYINTVKKTVELLKESGAKVELTQTDNEKFIEFKIKTYK